MKKKRKVKKPKKQNYNLLVAKSGCGKYYLNDPSFLQILVKHNPQFQNPHKIYHD
ncbi:MAG: hypothetical protein ABIG60_01840 [Patescibacteria group bacterium]